MLCHSDFLGLAAENCWGDSRNLAEMLLHISVDMRPTFPNLIWETHACMHLLRSHDIRKTARNFQQANDGSAKEGKTQKKPIITYTFTVKCSLETMQIMSDYGPDYLIRPFHAMHPLPVAFRATGL